MKRNEKGFSAVEGLLVLVIVALIGLAGWYVWHRNNTNKSSNTNSNSASSAANTSPTDYKTYGVINYCSDTGTSWCKFFQSDYQVGISYPNGWASSGETLNVLDGPVYTVTVAPKSEFAGEGREAGIQVNIYKGSLDKITQKRVQELKDKDMIVASSAVTVQKHKAMKLDYIPNDIEANTPASAYLIYSNGYVYEFDYVLHKDTKLITAKISEDIFDTFTLGW